MKTLIAILFTAGFCYSQTEGVPFNELDEKGERHGYWKSFVDSNLTMVEDSNKATWYFYRLFYHGEPLIGFNAIPVNVEELHEFELKKPGYSDSLASIDGIYYITWKRKTPMKYKLLFKNGFLIERHDILDPDGDNWDICKFDRKYQNNPYSFFYRKFYVWNRHKIRETYFYYENGKMKKHTAIREVESQNYFDNNEF